MNKKVLAEIATCLSYERLQAYCPTEPVKKQLSAYKKNIRLCKKMYVLLHYFEIIFRNAIDMTLTDFVQGAEWMDALPLDKESRRKIAEVKNVLHRQHKQATHGKIVSELTLGFWVALFTKNYGQYAFQNALIKNVFRFCPKNQRSIKNLQNCLNEVRLFRNRVCHYERIIHFDIRQTKTNILTYIAWISPAVHSLAKKSV